MTRTQQGIITLLRSAITGEKLALPAEFSWEEADPIIRSQSLLPLAYQGAYHCGVSMDSELMQRYKEQYFRCLMRSEQQMRAVRTLFAAFEENGIDYLPLKGCVLKELYPQPEMRMMGDADILIRVEQYDRIKTVMQELQFEMHKESSYDYVWIKEELMAELHRRLFGPENQDMFLYFGDGWDRAVKSEGCRYGFTPEDTYVYIFNHMTKHFRSWGIGARQIVDLYVYRAAYPDMDEEKVEQAMEKLHLLTFYRNIRKLLTGWFEGASEDPVTDCITAYVFSNGSWGSEKNAMYMNEILRSQNTGRVKNSKWKTIMNVLFPPLRHMQLLYNILYKYPFLYPFAWGVRWVDVLLHRRKNIQKKIATLQDVTDEKVSAHQQALSYMGLNFFIEETEAE